MYHVLLFCVCSYKKSFMSLPVKEVSHRFWSTQPVPQEGSGLGSDADRSRSWQRRSD